MAGQNGHKAKSGVFASLLSPKDYNIAIVIRSPIIVYKVGV